jgi:hypothetical protein
VNVVGLDLEREVAALGALEILDRPYVNSAYVTGSLLAGLGTATSDLDIVLLVANEADKLRAKQDKATRRHDPARSDREERVDYQVFTVAEFTAFVNGCTDFRAAWDAGRVYRIGEGLRALTQFTAAARILRPSTELKALHDRIVAHRSDLIRLAVAHTVLYANNTHEDLLGLAAQQDTVALLRLSLRHLEFGLDAWCTGRGFIYPDVKYKWVWRRLNQVLDDAEALDAIGELYLPEMASQPVPDVASRRLDMTQALLAQALLASWAVDQRGCAVPVLPRWVAAPSGLRRCPDWMPLRTSGAWRLGADFRFIQQPLPAAVTWAFAGGQPDEELETIVIEYCHVAFGEPVDAATVRSAISELLRQGALVRDGSG